MNIGVLSKFKIILLRKVLAALIYLCSCCCEDVSVLCFFLVMSCVGLWFEIVEFPGHTDLCFR